MPYTCVICGHLQEADNPYHPACSEACENKYFDQRAEAAGHLEPARRCTCGDFDCPVQELLY